MENEDKMILTSEGRKEAAKEHLIRNILVDVIGIVEEEAGPLGRRATAIIRKRYGLNDKHKVYGVGE